MSNSLKLSKNMHVVLSNAANYHGGIVFNVGGKRMPTIKALVSRGLVVVTKCELYSDDEWSLWHKYDVSSAGYQWLSENDSYFQDRYETWASYLHNGVVLGFPPEEAEIWQEGANAWLKDAFPPVSPLDIPHPLPDLVRWLDEETRLQKELIYTLSGAKRDMLNTALEAIRRKIQNQLMRESLEAGY